MVKRKLALLGATGSIGTSTLEVLREQSDRLELVLASGGRNYQRLLTLAREFDVPLLFLTGIDEPGLRDRIRRMFLEDTELGTGSSPNPGEGKELGTGSSPNPGTRRIYFEKADLLNALASDDYDICLNAIGASAGLSASHAVLKRGKPLALANKESLVMAGHILRPLWLKNNTPVIPVDSEHSAIFQAIGAHPQNELRRIHITASGGAFRTLPLDQFESITSQQALKHPNWDMGAKVTLDSATMVNKALEVMEAHWLFGLPYEAISALIHPSSVIHSLVEFIDGSILAQLSSPDMKLPIIHALSWPERWMSTLVNTDLLRVGPLEFHAIEPERYPLFYLGLAAAKAGGTMPTVFNAANEAALQLFLGGQIRFTGIREKVEEALSRHPNISDPDLETVLEVNGRVRATL